MREHQRNTRTYADNTSATMQKGWNENKAETTLKTSQDDAAAQRTEKNNTGSEGMMYLDIIPRFAL
jgi:hypothetical protein